MNTPTDPPTRQQSQLLAAAPDLLRELEAAHQIIRHALAVMTTEQKTVWGQLNAEAEVDGEGITRANERATVIARAGGEDVPARRPNLAAQAKPIDQEGSLFTMTPEQHQAMVGQTRQQFLAQRPRSETAQAKERELFARLATVRQYPIDNQ